MSLPDQEGPDHENEINHHQVPRQCGAEQFSTEGQCVGSQQKSHQQHHVYAE